jgi:ATP-dependent exoDNAse (exonuclease V) alpha subunit
VRLADGTTAGVGDRIVTRRNDRTITARRRWAKNSDQWIVTRRHRDGALTVQGDDSNEQVRLPEEYVREHVELGYATTAHRAQGRTVDTAHALVTSSAMTRESLHVAMTRRRQSNTAYIATDHDPDPDTRHGRIEPALAREIMQAILTRRAEEISARDTARSASAHPAVVQHAQAPTPDL